MDKNQFFNQYKPKSIDFKLPDGKTIKLNELTLEERAEVQDFIAIKENANLHTACVVALSCPLFTIDDVKKIAAMPGTLIASMSDAVLSVSGLAGDDEAKN